LDGDKKVLVKTKYNRFNQYITENEREFLSPYQGVKEESLKVKGGMTKLFPDPAIDRYDYPVKGKGFGEVLVVASRSPLKNVIYAVKKSAERSGISVLESVDALFTDFTDVRSPRTKQTQGKQVYTSEIAALSITFQVV